jgi:hypothetical protein
MPLIDKPADAVAELPQYRTLNSKRFDLGNGFHRIIHRLGRVHFQDDDGTLKDIDTSLRVDGNGDTVADQLPFRFRLLRQGIGYAYQSRSGGTVVCQLRRVGTTAISTTDTFTPTRNGNRLVFADVAPDTDIIIQVNRNGIQTWRRLKSDAAAKSWRWGIQYDAAGQAKIDATIRGVDGTDPRPRTLNGLAITDSQPQDNGDGTFTVLRQETWDGTVITVDPQTRVKSVTSDPAYPVLVDPDVSDHISANADDGFENTAYGFFSTYFGAGLIALGRSGFSPSFASLNPGFRFQSISVANGSLISAASLKVNIKGKLSNYAGGTLYGTASDSTAVWSASYKPSGQVKTSSHVTFPRPAGTGIVSMDVTAIIQEIVNRAGWASGNNVSLFVLQYEVTNRQTYIEDYHNAGTNEAVLEITLAAGGSAFNPYYYRHLAGRTSHF